MGRLTTHILDTANGTPAAGVTIELFSCDGERKLLKTVATNADGRTDQPLLDTDAFKLGRWELVFHIGDYFIAKGQASSGEGMPFLDRVPICFGLGEDAHYHVPLLASPWSYSTYRGS